MKPSILLIVLLLTANLSNAQSSLPDSKTLASSVGKWNGSLTYLDYSTGKPFSMAANLIIRQTKDQLGYIRRFEYPKEPHANSSDTLYLANQQFGDGQIVSFSQRAPGDFTLVTERQGRDGNDQKPARIRLTYHITPNQYQLVKDVLFDGSSTWVKRHEYLFSR
jgi:hypothetical protein